MNSNINTSEPSGSQPWQWIMASPTRMVGLILLGLALVLLLVLMVSVSQKPAKKKVEISVSQPSPTISPTPIPDPTQNWKTYDKITGISFKYPPEATAASTMSPTGRKLTGVQVSPKKESPAAEQPTLVIQVGSKSAYGFPSFSVQGLTNFYYQTIASSSATKRVITKPIEILVGGLKGYEYYIETNQFTSVWGTYHFKLGKSRIIHLEKDDKFYTILASLDEKIEQILSTVIINP